MEQVVEYCQRHEPRLRLSGIPEDEVIKNDSRVYSGSGNGRTRDAIEDLNRMGILRESLIQHRKVLFPGRSWINRFDIMRSQ